MRKNSIRLGFAVILAAALLMIIAAVSTVRSYAADHVYHTDLKENVLQPLWWPVYSTDTVTYLKIKPSKTGTITFTADFMCYVCLCDSKEKVISKGYDDSGDYIDPANTNAFMRKVHYGVKKGTTYYLRVYLMSTTKNKEGYYVGKVKYTNAKVSPSKSGSSRKKARAIKKNKTVKGLFAGGNRKAQWFKVTNKQKKTKIYFTASKINYALDVEVYFKSGRKWDKAATLLTWQTDYSKDVFLGKINKKVKHTYYIKVTPHGKTSGHYTIKWK